MGITLYGMFVVTVVAVASRENYYHKTTFLSVNSWLIVSATAPPQTQVIHLQFFSVGISDNIMFLVFLLFPWLHTSVYHCVASSPVSTDSLQILQPYS